MIVDPAIIENMREAEEAVAWCGRRKFLPDFVVVARAREHDDAIDANVLGHASGGGGTVRGTGKDDQVPF